MATAKSYESWSKEDLIARLTLLERNVKSKTAANYKATEHIRRPTQSNSKKPFNFAAYSRRKIALKFTYSGWEYSGLAFQAVPTPFPTVEGVIFDAMVMARLIDPDAGFEGCEWEKCGRTDAGVSAAGQVISLWIRSALKDADAAVVPPSGNGFSGETGEGTALSQLHNTEALLASDSVSLGSVEDSAGNIPQRQKDPVGAQPEHEREHDYTAILNRILPPTIRILGWSPVSSSFSARFSCTSRHYKYFFSSEGLDIELMRNAASRLIGLHDFRNMCKLDAGKQITVFERRILSAEIAPLNNAGIASVAAATPGDDGKMHVLNLIGTAFLYHQVRHIVAVLFLVGQGYEHPSIVNSLLNVKEGLEQAQEGDPELQVVGSKPEYQMAEALPLMLWDCAYAPEDVDWQTGGEEPGAGRGVYRHLHSIHARSQIYTALNDHFLTAASVLYPPPPPPTAATTATHLQLGGGKLRKTTQYTPLLLKNRISTVEIANERWRTGKGFRREQRKKLKEAAVAGDDEVGDT